jgi:hypothetical protein
MKARLCCATLAIPSLVLMSTPAFAEPSEIEMKEAVLAAMLGRGGAKSGDNGITMNNPINGMSLTFIQFNKIACEKASRPGFNCDYEYAGRMSAHSNEGTAAGNNHSQAVNALMGMLGAQESRGAGSKRFVKSGKRWIMIQEN